MLDEHEVDLNLAHHYTPRLLERVNQVQSPKKMVFLYEYFLYKEEGPGFLDFMRNFGG